MHRIIVSSGSACLALIAVLLWLGAALPAPALATGFLVLWSVYAFVSGVVAVPYNDMGASD